MNDSTDSLDAVLRSALQSRPEPAIANLAVRAMQRSMHAPRVARLSSARLARQRMWMRLTALAAVCLIASIVTLGVNRLGETAGFSALWTGTSASTSSSDTTTTVSLATSTSTSAATTTDSSIAQWLILGEIAVALVAALLAIRAVSNDAGASVDWSLLQWR